jgi:hypothetical protein
MITKSHLEANGHFDDINVARIAVKIAVGNTERELPAT